MSLVGVWSLNVCGNSWLRLGPDIQSQDGEKKKNVKITAKSECWLIMI